MSSILATQSQRQFEVISPLGKDVLLFHRLNGRETISELFEYHLELLSENANIDPDAILGQNLSVRAELAEGHRFFNAQVCRFSLCGFQGHLASYRATLRPWLWLLTRVSDCVIFQQKTAPDIVKEVLRKRGFTDFEEKLSGSYRQREYCVQYRETDYNFISRLLEEEGIYYYFKHESSKHTLVFADSLGAHQPIPDYASIRFVPPAKRHYDLEEHIFDWSVNREVQPGAYALTDFDFKKPRSDLRTRSNHIRSHARSDYEQYDYPGEYTETGDGEMYAKARVEEFQSQFEQVTGTGFVCAMFPGALFALREHPREDQNRQYLIISTMIDMQSNAYVSGNAGGGEDSRWCAFNAMESRQQYRPPRITPRPLMRGSQTAIVTGKQGEEIWTDEYGRIKVQFHWDRYGKSDENSSCWVRVAQPVAGAAWGWISIPRIGQEVVVDFLEGNPDQPLVTGVVYNADQMPPYTLPDNKTQSGIKSRTTKQGAGANFNELRFEDKKGVEEVYLHAEKDYNTVVENSATVKIGFDKKDPGNLTSEVYNDRTTSLEMGNDTLTIKKGDQVTHVSLGKSHLDAMQAIELVVGSNSIVINQQGITIKGLMISIEGAVKLDAKSPMTTVQGSGILTLQGGLIKIN